MGPGSVEQGMEPERGPVGMGVGGWGGGRGKVTQAGAGWEKAGSTGWAQAAGWVGRVGLVAAGVVGRALAGGVAGVVGTAQAVEAAGVVGRVVGEAVGPGRDMQVGARGREEAAAVLDTR